LVDSLYFFYTCRWMKNIYENTFESFIETFDGDHWDERDIVRY
jgi:hypothetical protein